MQKIANLALVVGLSFVTVFGCSSTERKVDDVAVDASPSDNPSEQIAALEKSIERARSRQAELLSPTWFHSAQKSLVRAKEARESGGNIRDITEHTAQGMAQIRKAEEFTDVSERNMKEVLQARSDALAAMGTARTAGATKTENLGSTFEDADKEFKEATQDIEDNDIKDAEKKKPALIAKYERVKSDSLEKEALDTAKRIVRQARSEGAARLAPKTLAYAEELIKSDEKFIRAGGSSDEEIAAKSKEAQFYAERALAVTREAKRFSEQKPEEIALWVEDRLVQLRADVPNASDQRNVSLNRQFDALASSMDSKGALENTSVASVDIAEAFAQRFSAGEAQVVRTENNQMVVRLPGLHFAPGKARLTQTQKGLLSRVAEVLKQYPSSQISIESYTDSTGSQAANLSLSKQRAEAVRRYLIGSHNFRPDQLTAEGLGPQNPIASNDSPDGRATNRRIEIGISPAELAEQPSKSKESATE